MPLKVVELGRRDYREVLMLQRSLNEARRAGAGEDTLLLVEHEPVFTVGRRRGASGNVLDPGDVPVVEVERGGDVTWHGPGQVVAYPVVALPPAVRDVHLVLRTLEEAGLRTVARWGLAGERDPRNAGVWIGGRKVAAVGIALHGWVTLHGMALNVHPDLGWTRRVHPCGLGADTVTSMARELGNPPDFASVREALTEELLRLLEPWTTP